jgi:hypothetical protein
MELADLQALIAKRGCELLYYTEGKVASIRLPSKEQVMVSMGTSSIKVFRKHWLFGWVIPRTILYVDLASIGWDQCIPLTRAVASVLLVAKAVDLLSQTGSISEMNEKYGSHFMDLLMESADKDMGKKC